MVHADPDMQGRIRSRLLALPPRAFELFAGDLLEFMGLREVQVTRYVGDGGIDAVGSLEAGDALIRLPTGVQVKRHRANVQRADIDRFIGALSGRFAHGIFITTAGYAPQAALKAASAFPRVATVDGRQVAALMLRHGLGVAARGDAPRALDEEYFGQLEAQAGGRLAERREPYAAEQALAAHPDDDLISLRALSHALRVDDSALRRRLERGQLHADRGGPGAGYFFRRARVEAIRAELAGHGRPASPDEWRQEFLAFARSKNLSKSYKPVLLKALLATVDRNGEAHLDDIAAGFRAFYVERKLQGLPVEFGPPDVSDPQALSDAQLRQLIVRNPLERFIIKGFLEYAPEQGIVRFNAQLWAELRYWELLDIRQRADEQLRYYYARQQ